MERLRNYRLHDGLEFMVWANEVHPEVFKEWVALKDIERSVEIEDEEEEDD